MANYNLTQCDTGTPGSEDFFYFVDLSEGKDGDRKIRLDLLASALATAGSSLWELDGVDYITPKAGKTISGAIIEGVIDGGSA